MNCSLLKTELLAPALLGPGDSDFHVLFTAKHRGVSMKLVVCQEELMVQWTAVDWMLLAACSEDSGPIVICMYLYISIYRTWIFLLHSCYYSYYSTYQYILYQFVVHNKAFVCKWCCWQQPFGFSSMCRLYFWELCSRTFKAGLPSKMGKILVTKKTLKDKLGGGFKYCLFSPLFGENSDFD